MKDLGFDPSLTSEHILLAITLFYFLCVDFLTFFLFFCSSFSCTLVAFSTLDLEYSQTWPKFIPLMYSSYCKCAHMKYLAIFYLPLARTGLQPEGLVETKWSSCFKGEAVISCDKCTDGWSKARTEKWPLGLVTRGIGDSEENASSGVLGVEKSGWSGLKKEPEGGIRESDNNKPFREVLLQKRSRKCLSSWSILNTEKRVFWVFFLFLMGDTMAYFCCWDCLNRRNLMIMMILYFSHSFS